MVRPTRIKKDTNTHANTSGILRLLSVPIRYIKRKIVLIKN